jgi:octaprenyl-diphosphate synthase
MAHPIEQIQRPIAHEIEAFEKKFRHSVKTNVLLLDKIMSYIVKRKGKQMRPILVFLSAGLCGRISESTHRAASLIELLHTASLVHDDVVDGAYYRRGFFSINAIWKNKVAVLVGDYLLARGLLLSVEHSEFECLRIVSTAVREMSEGELLQMEKARKLDITEDIYFDIIRQKTATLLAACCAAGASSAQADPDLVARMHAFGEKIGMAFQIKDDLFDYGTAEIGKPVGIDIKERKMTLPLIHALRQADAPTRRRMTNLVKNESDKPEKVKEVIAFVKSHGGIEYTQATMNRFFNEALDMLAHFPESEYKASMLQLVRYVIEREK